MIELSKILRLAFCCLVCIHELYELYLYKWQTEEERRIERGYAYVYSAVIIVWSLAELMTGII